MSVKLHGSCHSKSVTFTVHSQQPLPVLRCYRSICRKTAGGGGVANDAGIESELGGGEGQAGDRYCDRYSKQWLADWHAERGLTSPD